MVFLSARMILSRIIHKNIFAFVLMGWLFQKFENVEERLMLDLHATIGVGQH